MRKDKIQIKVKLDTAIDNFASIVNKFKSDVAGFLGEEYRNKTQYVRIRSLKTGSLIINSQLLMPEGLDFDATLVSVKEQILAANQLGGIPVLAVDKVGTWDPSTSEL